jgi:hypothetical protein
MIRARFTLSALAATLLIATPASATKYAGEFLKIPVGARAIGMGGAFVAVTDDATAPYWNPAGGVYLPYRDVIFQHAEKFGSLLNHDFLGGVIPLGGPTGHQSALGFSLIRLGVDNIPITPRAGGLRPGIDFLDLGRDNNDATVDADGSQGNGIWDPGERLLIRPEDLYLASSSDLAALVSYSRQRGSHFAYGANLKFVRQSIPDTIPGEHVTSFGAGLDAGLLYMPRPSITLGAVAHDLTTTYIGWSSGVREHVDPSLDTGVSFTFVPAERHALTWALDLAWAFNGPDLDSEIKLGKPTINVRTGLEYWFRSMFALRSGVDVKDLTFGAGIRYKHFGVDYAAQLHRFFASNDQDFPKDSDLDSTHLVSLSASW